MATKKTEKSTSKAKSKSAATAKKAAPKAAKKAKGATVNTSSRHPRARLTAAYGSKESLARTLAAALVRGDQSADALADQLKTASNAQLLRLAKVTEAVSKKWGSREKLIAAIGTAKKKSKDKDYLAKLETYSLPQLVDLAKSAERAARA